MNLRTDHKNLCFEQMIEITKQALTGNVKLLPYNHPDEVAKFMQVTYDKLKEILSDAMTSDK